MANIYTARRALTSSFHHTITTLKKIVYGAKGEPYSIGSHKLYYTPGTRPTRLRYRTSADSVVRNDAMQLAFAAETVRPGDFVLDIGAHKGQYAVLLSALVGDSGRVISFEPDTDAHAALHRNIALNGFESRVSIAPVVVLDRSGSHVFFSDHANSQSSVAASGLTGGSTSSAPKGRTIPTTSLDDFLRDGGHPVPDFAKIDIEGAEIHALRGATAMLAGDTTIMCELHPYAWPELGVTFDDLTALIRSSGRTARYLDPAFDFEEGPMYGAIVITR